MLMFLPEHSGHHRQIHPTQASEGTCAGMLHLWMPVILG